MSNNKLMCSTVHHAGSDDCLEDSLGLLKIKLSAIQYALDSTDNHSEDSLNGLSHYMSDAIKQLEEIKAALFEVETQNSGVIDSLAKMINPSIPVVKGVRSDD
jgi:hypothetical protein